MIGIITILACFLSSGTSRLTEFGKAPIDHHPPEQPFSQPYFDNSTKREIVTTVGQSAYLHCKVRNLGDKAVAWIRKRDRHILTVGILTLTHDHRYQSLHSDCSDEWTLKISSPQIRDSGTYECHVSTEPKISQEFRLSVVEYDPNQTTEPEKVAVTEKAPEILPQPDENKEKQGFEGDLEKLKGPKVGWRPIQVGWNLPTNNTKNLQSVDVQIDENKEKQGSEDGLDKIKEPKVDAKDSQNVDVQTDENKETEDTNDSSQENEEKSNEETPSTVPQLDNTTSEQFIEPKPTHVDKRYFVLKRGESWQSENGTSILKMQEDGNLVLYDRNGWALWSSKTVREGWQAKFQPDGNFVVYTKHGKSKWSSGTRGHPNAKLVIKDDEVVIYDNDEPIWESSTVECKKPDISQIPKGEEVQSTKPNEARPEFWLGRGKSWRSDTATLTMQEDGNLVLFNKFGHAIWDTKTIGKGWRTVYQKDNNLVVYNKRWRPVWASGTLKASSSARLVAQDDGHIVMYDGPRPFWSTYSERSPTNGTLLEGQPAPFPPKELEAPAVLKRGEFWSSATGTLIMQENGDLVLYDEYGKPLWNTKTNGKGWRAVFQSDGNFVVYSKIGMGVWSSKTFGNPGSTLTIGNDGNVVIYNGCRYIWATETRH